MDIIECTLSHLETRNISYVDKMYAFRTIIEEVEGLSDDDQNIILDSLFKESIPSTLKKYSERKLYKYMRYCIAYHFIKHEKLYQLYNQRFINLYTHIKNSKVLTF